VGSKDVAWHFLPSLMDYKCFKSVFYLTLCGLPYLLKMQFIYDFWIFVFSFHNWCPLCT
jgi:hypothetical protein